MDNHPNNRRIFNYRAARNCFKDLGATNGKYSRRKSDLETLLELGIYHCPLEHQKPDVRNHGVNTVRALADMFTCKLTNFPVVIGIFAPPNKEDYLSCLARELHNLNRLVDPIELKFNVLLFLFPFVMSIALGYVSGMLTNWRIGLSVGHAGMFIQIALLASIITGSRVFHQKLAVQAGRKLARFVRWLHLVLCVCFFHPTRPFCKDSPVKTIVVYHRLFPSSTPNVALFALMDKMWTGLIRIYGEIPIRLQRVSKGPVNQKQRFKRICCIPSVLVVIAFSIAFLVATGIMRYHAGHLAEMLGHTAVIFAFVLMSSIIFLSLFGSLPSLCRLIKGLSISPLKPLRTALAEFLSEETDNAEIDEMKGKLNMEYFTKLRGRVNETVTMGNSTSLKNLAISAAEERARVADIKVKEEFSKLCKISLSFDSFLAQHQTRFIICLDASETNQRDVLARLIYQLHSLILSESSAPVAIVLEANFKVLLGELASNTICPPHDNDSLHVASSNVKSVTQTLSDNLHLVHTSIHLPIYLETPVYLNVECECGREEDEMIPNSIITSPNGCSTDSPKYMKQKCSYIGSRAFYDTPRQLTTNTTRSLCPGTAYTFGLRDSNAYFGMHDATKGVEVSKNEPRDPLRSSSMSGRSLESCHGIAELFLKDHYLADWNRKVMKQLIAATAFSNRLQRLCNLHIPTDELVFWVTVVHYWPYHMAWMIIQLDELLSGNCNSRGKQHFNHTMINLHECLAEVKHSVANSLETLDQLITDDRDLERLEQYLLNRPPISLLNLKKLISCVLTHNPFLRLCIEALVLNAPTRTSQQEPSVRAVGRIHGSVASLASKVFPNSNAHDSGSGIRAIETPIVNQADQMRMQTPYSSFMNPAYSADNVMVSGDWPSPVNLKQSTSSAINSEIKDPHVANYSVQDVCELLATIPTIPRDHIQRYQVNVLQEHIDGKCLLTSEIETLWRRLKVDPEDWQAFLHLLKYLRKSSGLSQIESAGIRKPLACESETGSAATALTVRNKKVIQNRTRLGSSSPSGTYPVLSQASILTTNGSGKSSVMVRQTPWLLSPMVSTGPNNNDMHMEKSSESISPLANSMEATENYTSPSGLEEPESLWKPTGTTLPNNASCLPSSIVTKASSRADCELLGSDDAEIFTNSQAIKMQSEDMNIMSSTFLESKAHTLKTQNYYPTRHKKRTARRKRPKVEHISSRSTVDLRTVIDPAVQHWPCAMDPSVMKYYHAKGRNLYRDSFHSTLYNRHAFENTCQPTEADLYYAPPWNRSDASTCFPKIRPCSVDLRLRNQPSMKDMPNSGGRDDGHTDLRRMRKRLCTRNEDTASRQKQECFNIQLPFPPIVDSDFGEPIPTKVCDLSYSEYPMSKDKRASHFNHSQSPAHEEIADFRSHIARGHWAGSNHSPTCVCTSPGLNKLGRDTSPRVRLIPSKSKTQFGKYGLDRMWHDTRTGILNWDPPSHTREFISPGRGFRFRTVSINHTPELCTCNYWYNIEQAIGKTTNSEPTLRDYSSVTSSESSSDAFRSSADNATERAELCIDVKRCSSQHSRGSIDRPIGNERNE